MLSLLNKIMILLKKDDTIKHAEAAQCASFRSSCVLLLIPTFHRGNCICLELHLFAGKLYMIVKSSLHFYFFDFTITALRSNSSGRYFFPRAIITMVPFLDCLLLLLLPVLTPDRVCCRHFPESIINPSCRVHGAEAGDWSPLCDGAALLGSRAHYGSAVCSPEVHRVSWCVNFIAENTKNKEDQMAVREKSHLDFHC